MNLRGDAEDGVKGRDRQMEWTETGTDEIGVGEWSSKPG